MNDYIDYLSEIRGYSPRTCETYKRILLAFATWAKAHDANARWSTINSDIIEEYIIQLAAKGYTANTTNLVIETLRGFYRWMHKKGIASVNPAREVELKKLPKTEPIELSVDDIYRCYQAANETIKVIIMILYSTGIRISELCNMTWEDINISNRSILINGKGAKQRYVYINSSVLERLQALTHPQKRHGIIFGIGARMIRHRLYEASQAAGLERPISPHQIRSTIATTWSREGANNTTLAKALGHSSVETSQKYVNKASINVRGMMDNINLDKLMYNDKI